MLEAIANGFMLWLRNLPLLSALVLTVWLPSNILLNYAISQADADSPATEYWIPIGLEALFGPLCLGAIVYALDQRRQNRPAGYFQSLRAGFRFWGKLFFTRLIADIQL
ncbi:MAG: hypothetical protein CMJ64_09615 [Planctomycetaceae bacterium]|nr:hypothetical protein [Planctomycetaceae bacterium]